MIFSLGGLINSSIEQAVSELGYLLPTLEDLEIVTNAVTVSAAELVELIV